jgi:hypothetical protein
VTSLQTSPKETATHLSLSALSALSAKDTAPTEEMILAEIKRTVGDVELPEEVGVAAGEMCVLLYCRRDTTLLIYLSVPGHLLQIFPTPLHSSVGWLHRRASK